MRYRYDTGVIEDIKYVFASIITFVAILGWIFFLSLVIAYFTNKLDDLLVLIWEVTR